MYDIKNLNHLGSLGKNNEASMKALQAFNDSVFSDGEIPLKYKELIAVAVAISKQCAYCIEVHKKSAIKAGASETELSEAVFIASAIGAGVAVTHGTHLF